MACKVWMMRSPPAPPHVHIMGLVFFSPAPADTPEVCVCDTEALYIHSDSYFAN